MFIKACLRSLTVLALLFSLGLSPFDSAPASESLSKEAQVGRFAFFDTGLSVSSRQSCASCHDPSYAYAPNNNRAVQLGGADLDQPGLRAVPSLRYLQTNSKLRLSKKNLPIGGFNHSGSADTLAKQAEGPLLAANEMGNGSIGNVAKNVRRAPYFAQLKSAFNLENAPSDKAIYDALLASLERFQLEDASFHPYDSKYDAYLAGRVQLTPSELRGLLLFNDSTKGNCSACHISHSTDVDSPPLFTDFSFDALGVPRNMEIPANSNPQYFDLGLCSSESPNPFRDPKYCGKFKVPTLRNVATRQVFFHNGKMKSLKETISFYATRDTQPAFWYGRQPSGRIVMYNDLPENFRTNVNRDEAPYDRKIGKIPRLNDQDIDDIIEFLKTLSDGYSSHQ